MNGITNSDRGASRRCCNGPDDAGSATFRAEWPRNPAFGLDLRQSGQGRGRGKVWRPEGPEPRGVAFAQNPPCYDCAGYQKGTKNAPRRPASEFRTAEKVV